MKEETRGKVREQRRREKRKEEKNEEIEMRRDKHGRRNERKPLENNREERL